jgi:hypothetical protein
MSNQIPPGEYFARCTKADLGFTSTGKEQAVLTFRLRDTDADLRWFGYFSDKAIEICLKAIRTAGFTDTDLGKLPDWVPGDAAPDVVLSVGHELYEGKTQVKVNWVNSAHAQLKNAMTPEQRAAFGKKMKAAVVLHAKAQGAQEKKTEDIPF